MRQPDRLWKKAMAVAKRAGLDRRTCYPCQRKGVVRKPDRRTKTGYVLIDPCPHCDGYGFGFLWGPEEVVSASELLRRTTESAVW